MASDERTLPILTHIIAYLFGWLGPLIILLVTEREVVKQHARRALNWQLTYLLYFFVLFIILFISIPFTVVVVGFFTLALAIMLLIALAICDIAFSIIAAVRASNDELYTYPLTIGFVSDPKSEEKVPPRTRKRS